MPVHEQVALRVLEDGLDDWVPIDTLLWYAREAGEQGGGDFKRIVSDSLDFLLSRGLATVGDLGETGFEAWQGDAVALVRRVVACCEKFDWEPRGAGCWISNTPEGSALVSEE